MPGCPFGGSCTTARRTPTRSGKVAGWYSATVTGVLFSSLTGSLDVIAHELGHGVTEDEGALEYFGQSGALNESLSDVRGSLVKQYKLQQTAEEADWLIGSDVFRTRSSVMHSAP